MSELRRATSYVYDGEKALSISEMDRMPPDNSAWHRYQIIYVIRDDTPAEFTKDLGLSINFREWTNPFCIYSLMEYTVAELMEMAEQVRATPPYDKRELAGVNKVRN